MDHAALASRLTHRLASHPPGHLGQGARMGAALHSEDLGVIDLVCEDDQAPWTARRAQAHDPQATPFGPEGDARFQPERFVRSRHTPLREHLTLATLPAMPFVHAKGGRYQGVAVAFLDDTPHAVYTDADGVWWIRPWTMFADGRFQHDTPRITHWIPCMHTAQDGA